MFDDFALLRGVVLVVGVDVGHEGNIIAQCLGGTALALAALPRSEFVRRAKCVVHFVSGRSGRQRVFTYVAGVGIPVGVALRGSSETGAKGVLVDNVLTCTFDEHALHRGVVGADVGAHVIVGRATSDLSSASLASRRRQ